MNVSSLSGVILLSRLLTGNTTLPAPNHVVDAHEDMNTLLLVALPAAALSLFGILFVISHTDDDGFISGKRTVESEYPLYRLATTIMTYMLEGLSVGLVPFAADSARSLKGGSAMLSMSEALLLASGSAVTTLFVPVSIVLVILSLLFAIPTVLWYTLRRKTFAVFEEHYTKSPPGAVISFLQDCLLVYLVIPLLMPLLLTLPCTYYISGEAATALDETTLCGSRRHIKFIIVAIVISCTVLFLGVLAGTLPTLVRRYTDVAINGRFLGISFVVKVLLVVSYVVCGARHRWWHLISTLILQIGLLFFSVTMRPCLIERVNFHR